MVVLVNDNEISNELCDELRTKFLAEVKESPNLYEDVDIERFQNDTQYCRRFLLHKKGDLDQAFQMVKDALAWRKSFNVKNIREDTIPYEFFTAKAVFPYNSDKDGNPIIMLLVRYHRKDPEIALDLRRFLVYWVEKMEAQTTTGKITVIMNCMESGLSHLDLDLIKFLITLFRSYYPHALAYILIHEMPWIFNAAWKIIKSWLPEDTVDKIKFVNKTSILQYVDKDSLSLEMGGTDSHEYEPHFAEGDVNSNSLGRESTSDVKKRVHFAENGHPSSEQQNGPFVSSGLLSPRSSREVTSPEFSTIDFCILGGIIKISPANTLSFLCTNSNFEASSAKIQLTCISKNFVAYKVKTNNIEGYRVKPSTGIIQPGKSAEINVFVVQGYRPSENDKFLIMAMEVSEPALATNSLNVLWRTTPPGSVLDHKLRCIMEHQDEEKGDSNVEIALKNIGNLLTNLNSKVQRLEEQQASLHSNQNKTLFVLFLVSAMCFILLINANSDILYSIL